MQKSVLYAVTAIFLGTMTMVVPLMTFKPKYFELLTSGVTRGSPEFWETLDEDAQTFKQGGALERAVSSTNLSAVGLLLLPSFLLAVGFSLYLKRRMFYS